MSNPTLSIDKAILENLPVAVSVCDADGVIAWCNRKATEFWGRSPRLGDPLERFCGAHKLFRHDGRPLPHRESPTAEVLRTGNSASNLEVIVEKPNGERVWALAHIDAIKNEAGEVIGAISCFQDITARKDAEKTMRESLVLSRTITETTPECVKVVAYDGRILQMNPAGRRMIEADTAEAVEGGCVFDLIAPEHRELWRINHERVCNGERLSWEYDIAGLRGTRRRLETHAAPLRMLDGAAASLAITRDITERKKHEIELSDRERWFREVLNAFPAAVYTTDAEGRITFYNQAALEFSGRRPELGSDQWCVSWRFYAQDGTPLRHDECPMAKALREDRPIRGIEATAERSDGTRIPFIPYPTPLHDASGALIGAVNMLLDITERKRAEQTLIESEQMARGIIDTALDAFIQMNEAGIVLEWNAQAENIFGWSRQEAVGSALTALIVPPAVRDIHKEGLDRFLSSGEAPNLGKRLQLEALRRNGATITVELTVTSLRRGNGHVFNAFIRDITEKLAAEAQLHQAQKMEVLGQLTGGVAHDFNNLLMVISAGLDMIERRPDPARERLLLDGMHHAVERGAGLTRQLLAFSRRQALKPEAVDLRKQIEAMRELLDRSLRGDVQIALDFAADLWPVEVDPGELELAVLNLAVNARDAMPQGGDIVLRARNIPEHERSGLEAASVRLDVVDTGTGMSPDVQARVFEPFYTTKKAGKGSGLGLAQVYGFVKQSRGTVEIDSKAGSGTTISLFLPRSSKPPAVEHAHTGNSSNERPLNGALGHVLLVEDDEEVAALVTEMLAQLGFEVTRTASANAALGALANERVVDLVFSDVMMPGGMNGVDLAREVKRRRPGLPVLLTSGYAEAAAADAGAEGIMLLPKPYRLEALAATISEALNQPCTLQRDAAPLAGQTIAALQAER